MGKDIAIERAVCLPVIKLLASYDVGYRIGSGALKRIFECRPSPEFDGAIRKYKTCADICLAGNHHNSGN